jgi:hypothetical protein
MSTISPAARFAERTTHLRASTIREMLKVTQQPDVINGTVIRSPRSSSILKRSLS